MALSDKNIVITPNQGQSADPKVDFIGASSTLGPQTISLNVYPTSNGTLSFEGSAGQLFSVTNSLTGTIYSVNDVSGIPSIEVLDTGLVKLAQYGGNVVIGDNTENAEVKLQVTGGGFFTGQIGNYRFLRGVYLGLRGIDPQIQLQGVEGSEQPHIDFSNSLTDYDMRIILTGDDTLDIMGGNLTIEGNTVLHAANYSQYVSGGGGGGSIPAGSMLSSYFSSAPAGGYLLLDGTYQSAITYPILQTLGFPSRPAFGGIVGGVTGNPNNAVQVEVESQQYYSESFDDNIGPNLIDGTLCWEDWPGAGWHTAYVYLAAEIYAYAIFTFPIPTIIDTYAILPRSGNDGLTDRWWVYQWKWYASNDKQNWTLLEHQNVRGFGEYYMNQGATNIQNAGGFYLNNWPIPDDTIFSGLNRIMPPGFEQGGSNNTPYRYYKFVPMDGEWGDTSYIFVNEIRLMGYSYSEDPDQRLVPLAPQGQNGLYYYLKV